MFHVCELQQRLPEKLHMPKDIDAASDGVVKREQTRSAQIGKKCRVLVGVTPKSKRAPVAHHAQATGAFLLPRQGDGVVVASLVEL